MQNEITISCPCGSKENHFVDPLTPWNLDYTCDNCGSVFRVSSVLAPPLNMNIQFQVREMQKKGYGRQWFLDNGHHNDGVIDTVHVRTWTQFLDGKMDRFVLMDAYDDARSIAFLLNKEELTSTNKENDNE